MALEYDIKNILKLIESKKFFKSVGEVTEIILAKSNGIAFLVEEEENCHGLKIAIILKLGSGEVKGIYNLEFYPIYRFASIDKNYMFEGYGYWHCNTTTT
jgi:hypothetical protein